MKKRIKSPWFWLVVALVLCFVSMIGTSCMQTNWGKNDVSVFTGTLSDVAGMIRDSSRQGYTGDIYRRYSKLVQLYDYHS